MSPVAPSEAGERKMPLSLAEVAGFAETAPNRIICRKARSYFGILSFSVSSAAPSAAGERKEHLSLTEPAEIAETTQKE